MSSFRFRVNNDHTDNAAILNDFGHIVRNRNSISPTGIHIVGNLINIIYRVKTTIKTTLSCTLAMLLVLIVMFRIVLLL